MVHYLKTVQPHFGDVWSGRKTFEVRYNDRNYQLGDYLVLQEYDAERAMLTGAEITAEVKYLLRDEHFCKEGFVIMGIDAFKFQTA
jgi:hypothetical protein